MNIHTVSFSPSDWMLLMQQLSQLDRFDASWQAIERREKQALKELKSIATVQSIGASTRIEGSQLTDREVGTLIDHLDINKLTDRDQQEVAGYYEALNLIGESYRDINISESNIKHLHNVLMRYSGKDGYHKGNYKINTNRVERKEADGTVTPIFETTSPGWPTQDAMRLLMNWYLNDSTTHSLIRTAIFVYEFLSIHPFQDGNGRLSRLLATLLLLKSGYVWIEYVSFEHEIEFRKKEYYKNLMDAQRERPGEDVTNWVYFFLDCLKNLQEKLLQKVKNKEKRENVGMREQHIYNLVEHHPGISSGEIAKKLNIPSPTVKRILSDLVNTRNLVVHGAGRGTKYSIAVAAETTRDLTIRFSNQQREYSFVLSHMGALLRIRKIVLTPLFAWKHPNEWAAKLSSNGLYITIKALTSKGELLQQSYAVAAYNDPNYFQPVFIINPNIIIPGQLKKNGGFKFDYPISCTISLSGSTDILDFDVMLVTDEEV